MDLKNIFLAILLILGFGYAYGQPTSQITIIKAGHIVHPEKKEAIPNQVLVIEDKRIKSIHALEGFAFPDSATIIDLSNHYVLPGLIEAHTHICMALPPGKFGGNMRNYWEDFLSYTTTNTTAYRALVGAKTAKELLQAGFTTIRDLGNAGNYADTEVRRAIEEGLIEGPTIVNAGKIIAPLGGQYISQMKPDLAKWFDNEIGDYVGVLSPESNILENPDYLFADTEAELKKAIRQNILFGAKVIKIVVDDQQFSYSQEDIEFIVKETGRAGLKVAAHCITEQGAINAIAGGVHSIEHGSGMTEAALKLAKEKGIFLVPAGGPLKEAFDLGVNLAFGADNIRASTDNLSRTAAILRYLPYYKNKEIPDAAILQMLTTNGVALLGMNKQRGQLAPSFYADIIAVKNNPLENISVLNQVDFVMKERKVVK